jgi:hypothetical protein
VRAYNIVSFINSTGLRYTIEELDLYVARCVLELYETPTPFKGKLQDGVILPLVGTRPQPHPRRPSFENQPELGYPVAWLEHSEGRRKSRANFAAEVTIFRELTKSFREDQAFQQWLTTRTPSRSPAPTPTLVEDVQPRNPPQPPSPATRTPPNPFRNPPPTLSYREKLPQDSDSEAIPSPFAGTKRGQGTSSTPKEAAQRQEEASLPDSPRLRPKDRRRRKKKLRQTRQNGSRDKSVTASQQLPQMESTPPQRESPRPAAAAPPVHSSPQEGPFAKRLRESNLAMHRRVTSQMTGF